MPFADSPVHGLENHGPTVGGSKDAAMATPTMEFVFKERPECLACIHAIFVRACSFMKWRRQWDGEE